VCSIKKRNSRLEFLFFSIDGHNDFALNEDFRKAIVRNKIWYPIQGGKTEYTEYEDVDDYLKFKKEQYNKILKYLFDEINKQLIPIENLSVNFKEIYNYKNKQIIKYLQKTIKEEKIITDTEFASLLIHLNNKWIKSFEISYYIRFIVEYVDNELVWKNLLYSEFRKLPHYPYGSQIDNGCQEIYKFNFFWKYKKRDSWILKFYPLKRRRFKRRVISYHRGNIDYLFKKDYRTNYIKQVLNHDDIARFRFYDKFKKGYWKFEDEDLREKNFALVKQDLREEWFENKWKREQILFENVQTILSDKNIPVIRWFSPQKLKRQNLDIYFEYKGKKYGIEHQGEQHYKPIKHWGGRKGYNHRVKLDKLKKMRCKRAKINFVEFGYFEEINKFAIIKKLKNFGINLNYERRLYV
jgi:hypothetical protein